MYLAKDVLLSFSFTLTAWFPLSPCLAEPVKPAPPPHNAPQSNKAHPAPASSSISASSSKAASHSAASPLHSQTYKPTEFIRDHTHNRTRHGKNNVSADVVEGYDEVTSPVWERPGDLLLGVVMSLTSYHQDAPLCGFSVRRPSALHRLHSIVFAIEEINRRRDILPDVNLGFVVMDDCSRDNAALLRALRFIPAPSCHNNINTSQQVSANTNTNDGSSSATTTTNNNSINNNIIDNSNNRCPSSSTMYGGSGLKSYPVVGVIGAELSESSMQMAALLSPFRVPQLSYSSSSTFLSDKNKYGYFSRLVPSDRQQARAIVDILSHFDWSYVAVVYSYGVYGLSGFRYIRNAMEEKGLCLAVTLATEYEYDDEDYDSIIVDLLNTRPKVKVVVLFSLHAGNVLQAAQRAGVGGRFVWVASDALIPNVEDFDGYEEVSLGMLVVGFPTGPVQRFEKVFQYSTLRNSTENPWFSRFYQQMFNCTTQTSPTTPSLPLCDLDRPIRESTEYESNTSVMRAVNAVYTFARALHTVMDGKNCTKPYKRCFTPRELLGSLRRTSFDGENGLRVGMDPETGNGIAAYQVQIQNLQRDPDGTYKFRTVGHWNGTLQSLLFFNEHDIMWHPNTTDRITASDSSNTTHEFVPKSTCRQQCTMGQQAVPTWPRCCWVCKACRENEFTVIEDGLQICNPCSTTEGNYTWPDSETRTYCEPIEPTYHSFGSTAGLALMALDFLVLALVLFSTLLYWRSRANRLIKATSRELSGLMLLGHFLACLAVPALLAKPTVASCTLSHVTFHVSLTLVYAPLLVRINRIHRIFFSGRRSARKPRFIGSGVQLMVSIAVVFAHLLMVAVWMFLDPPTHKLRMPSPAHRYVERVCDIPERGFLASLIVNLILMGACALHSLSTRKLPVNYNEAKFITVCVYTIVVLWFSFLAAYYVIDNGLVHVLCLTLILLVNVISCQAFLFVPKLYAVHRRLPTSKLHVASGPVTDSLGESTPIETTPSKL